MIADEINVSIEEMLESITDTDRQKLAASIFEWVATKTRKKPVADLPQRLKSFQSDLEEMTRAMAFSYKDGTLYLEAYGRNDKTLMHLAYGSDWFEGHPRLGDFLLEKLFPQQVNSI